ncbi:uncharacterized protein LOC110942593 [Helianthus annuus]|uniref:uncharacterized protein LOC110942593 n=1 Tax=Helianthus annuus TaxID=4232 RepID=UPI000B8F47EE|nr:uncharacterized protein LOC110942593 [Helianthus annuus]
MSGHPRLRNFFKGYVGNGENILFWLDPWLRDVPLMEVFPKLFMLETVKNCSVRDRLTGEWLWKHDPVMEDEIIELDALIAEVAAVSLRDRKDDWKWLPDRSGLFSVRSVKKLFEVAEVDNNRYVIERCKWVPIKCNVFVWRVELNRIPTADALRKRGIQVGNGVCPLCKTDDESVEHIFTSCIVAVILWQKVSWWCGMAPIYAFSVKDLLDVHKDRNINSGVKHVVQGIMFISVWCLWLARNRAVFSNADVKVDSVFSEVRDWCKFVNL